MKVKRFGAQYDLNKIQKFINRKDIKIKHIAGSQSGLLGYIFIFYE